VRRRLLLIITIALAASPLMAPSAQANIGAGGPGPPNGYFVVGDLSANVGATVELWGAQWAKVNRLSGGQAPRAFKGFADTADNPSEFLAEMGTDRARVVVLVGHDFYSLEAELMKQLSYRFGLVPAQLQQQRATDTQPTDASSHDLYQ
jgi:hypothetical protein